MAPTLLWMYGGGKITLAYKKKESFKLTSLRNPVLPSQEQELEELIGWIVCSRFNFYLGSPLANYNQKQSEFGGTEREYLEYLA